MGRKKDHDRDGPGYYKGEKLKPGLTQEFVERVEALSTQGMKDLVVEIQKGIDDSKVFLKTNEDIVELEKKLDLAKGPTQETIRHLNNKTKFLIDRIKEVEPSTT